MKYFLLALFLIPLVQADLSAYPEFLFSDGEFQGIIVVGKSAPTMDITSTILLIPGLQTLSDDRIRGSTLDEDVDDFDYLSNHLISVGTACDNDVTARIMDADDCDDYFTDNAGYIYLYKSELDKHQIVVAGNDPEDTAKAAAVLGDYENYNLQGNAFKVTGSDPYTVTAISLPSVELVPELSDIESEGYNEITMDDTSGKETQYEETDLDFIRERAEESNLPEVDDEVLVAMEHGDPEEEPEEPFIKRMWEGFKGWLSWFFK